MCLWPQTDAEQKASVRLNLVWEGQLVAKESLHADTLVLQVAQTLGSLRGQTRDRLVADRGTLVAVPQEHLDPLLAVGRWFQDGALAGGVIVALRDGSHESLREATAQIILGSQALLSALSRPLQAGMRQGYEAAACA